MNFLQDYLERRRQVRDEESAQRDADSSSPEELLEALKANTGNTSDLLGDRSKEAKEQTKSIVDSLEIVATSVTSLNSDKDKATKDAAAKQAAAAEFKLNTFSTKNLVDINSTLEKLLVTNQLIEKHLRPELNSKDDTYAKHKEAAAAVVGKEKPKFGASAGFGMGGLLFDALAMTYEWAKDKLTKDKIKPGEAGKPGEPGKPGKPGEVGKPGEAAKPKAMGDIEAKPVKTSEAIGRKAGRLVGEAKNAVGDLKIKAGEAITKYSPKVQSFVSRAAEATEKVVSKVGEISKPITTKIGELATKAIESPLGKTVTRVGSEAIESARPVANQLLENAKSGASKAADYSARAYEASKPVAKQLLENAKSGGSKALDWAGRAAEASKPMVSKAANAIDAVHNFGADLIGKIKPAAIEGVTGAAPAATSALGGVAPAVAESAAPSMLSRGAGALKGMGGTALKWAGRLATPVAAALSAKEAYDTEQDQTITRDEKNVKHAGTGGGLLGAIGGGMAAGAVLGTVVPGAGNVAGAVVGGLGGLAGYYGGSKLGETAMGAYQTSRDYVADNYTKAKDSVSSGWDSVKNFAGNAWDSTKEGAKSAVGGLQNAGAAVGTVGALAATNLSSVASSGGKAALEGGKTALGAAPSPLLSLIPGVGALAALTSSMSNTKPTATSAVGGIGEVAKPVNTSGLNTALGSAVALAISPFSQDARDALKSDLMPALEGVGTKFDAASRDLKAGIADTNATMTANVAKASEAFTLSFTSLTTKLTDAWDATKSVGRSVMAGARQAASSVSEAVSSTASGVVEGTKSGYKAAAGTATGVKDVASGVVGAVKGAFTGGREAGSKASEQLAKDLSISKGIAVGRYNTEEQAALTKGQQAGEKFRGGKGLTQESKDMITKIATEKGIPPEHMLAMAQMESGGNANAVSSTGAAGMYQFTGGTAKEMGLKNRFDPEQNTRAAADLYLKNKAALEKGGEKATLDNIYMAHQEGAGGAMNILKASRGEKGLSETVKTNMGYNVGAGAGGGTDAEKATKFLAANQKALANANATQQKVTLANDAYTKTTTPGTAVAKASDTKSPVADATPPKTSVAAKTSTPPAVVPETAVALSAQGLAPSAAKAVAKAKARDAADPEGAKIAATDNSGINVKMTVAPKPVDTVAEEPKMKVATRGIKAVGTESSGEEPVRLREDQPTAESLRRSTPKTTQSPAPVNPAPEIVGDAYASVKYVPTEDKATRQESRTAPKISFNAEAVRPDMVEAVAPKTEQYTAPKYTPTMGAAAPASEPKPTLAQRLGDPIAHIAQQATTMAKGVVDSVGLSKINLGEGYTTTASSTTMSRAADDALQASNFMQAMPTFNTRQSAPPTLSSNVPEETKPVSVSNTEELAKFAGQGGQSTLPPVMQGNSFDTAVPRLDNIPLQVTDLGLVLLNIGHV